MRLLTLFVSAFAVLAAAQTNPNPITSPTGGTIQAGNTVTITWTPTTKGTVSLQLRSGNPSNLAAGMPIATSIPNTGSYTWTSSSSITSRSDYTIEIIDDSNIGNTNYSPMFTISSAGASAGSSVTAGSAASQISTPPASVSPGGVASSASGSAVSASISTSVPATISTSVSSNTTTSSGASSASNASSKLSTSTSSSISKPSSTSNAAVAQYRDTELLATVFGLAAVVALF